METQTPPPRPDEDPVRSEEPFVRVRHRRLLGGVATGIARRFDVPLWLVRVGFVVLATAGGLGFALYGIGWLAVRDEYESEPIATRFVRRIDGSAGWIGVALIGIALLMVVGSIGFVRGDVGAAIILGVLGVLLYRGELDFSSASSPASVSGPPTSAPVPPSPGMSAAATATAPSSATTSPAPPLSRPPTRPRPEPSNLGKITFAIGALVLGAMGVSDSWVTDVDFSLRHYVSTAMLIAGLGLLVGAFVGRARGLIVVGVILTPVVFFSPIGDLDLSGSVGERHLDFDTVAEIPETIDLGAGSLRVDLSNVDFDGESVSTFVDIGIGEVIFYVPDDVETNVRAEMGLGEVIVFGRTQQGVGIDLTNVHDGANGTLDLTIDGGVGSVRVIAREVSDTAPTAQGPSGFGDDAVLTPETLDSTYALSDGNWRLDLSNVVIPTDGVRTRITLAEGSLFITVPEGIDVSVRSVVREGVLSVFDEEMAGTDLVDQFGEQADADITIDVVVDSGVLIISEENS